mmetsp:Transcript_12193/g.18714  ORF Transcript_12193/g.18714 Transcript_12193/m.18714 type:complete len:102 (+) Transcript_12193:1069-1374(+)
MYPVPRARNWYTPGEEEELILVQHVVATKLELQPLSRTLKLPRTCDVTAAKRKGARKLSSTSHGKILEEIGRREELEFERTLENLDGSGNESGESDSTEDE